MVRYLIVLIWALCISCKEKNKDATSIISNKSFPEGKKIKFEEVKLDLIGKIVDLAVVDTFLICSDLSSEKILHIIGINSNKYYGQLINRGLGPGECTNISDIIVTSDKGTFWAYDGTLGKLMKIDIYKALKEKKYLPEKEMMVAGAARGAKSVNWVNDDLFAASSYAFEDCRYFYFNTKSDTVSKFGELPQAKEDWPKQSSKSKLALRPMAYAAKIKKKPSTDIVAVAYYTWDRIEIYERGNIKQVICGPNVEPNYTFRDVGQGMYIPNYNLEFSAIDLDASDKYIYSLYSGSSDFQKYCQKILVFDWKGNPIKILEFNNKLSSICIIEKENSKIIYAVDEGSGNIVMTKDKDDKIRMKSNLRG
jgi:hypothetical protein